MDGVCDLEPALDFEHCERARYRRDPAYDGVIFIGVTSTRIYCRPVCPVRQPLSKNVRYYPSAASAEAAGFRPCLRCRPETAPQSPAWKGVRATVGRALRLIEEGALDDGDTAALADRLGVGARHLSRLFRTHLGSTPARVARTARVQRAKRLIDETDLPMTEIAAQAGFASLRSFNATFREVYRCAPTAFAEGVAGSRRDFRRRKPPMRERLVTVSENGKGDFGVTVAIGSHLLNVDEPVEAGGQGNGPDPFEMLMAGLGACGAMTIRLYARRKAWPLEHVEVQVTHPVRRSEGAARDGFDRRITLGGALTPEMRARLVTIAAHCPVSRALTEGSSVTENLVEPAA